MDMVGEAIEQRAGQTLIAEDARPFVQWKIGCDDRRPAFVTLAEDLEEQFRAGPRLSTSSGAAHIRGRQ
jgi:hypothetical protein